MDRDAFTRTMRAFRNQTPYRPFTVTLVNGNRYEVDHPESLALRDGLAVFALPGSIPIFFDYDGVSEIIGGLSGQSTEAQ